MFEDGRENGGARSKMKNERKDGEKKFRVPKDDFGGVIFVPNE